MERRIVRIVQMPQSLDRLRDPQAYGDELVQSVEVSERLDLRSDDGFIFPTGLRITEARQRTTPPEQKHIVIVKISN